MIPGFEGAFFAIVDKPRSWYSIGKSDSGTKEGIDALFKRYSECLEGELSTDPDGALARLSRAPETALSPRQVKQRKVQRYQLGSHGQCSLTVLPAACALASHLGRVIVMPYVHADEDFLVCFCGQLSNIFELSERVHGVDLLDQGQRDSGETTTKLIIKLYQQLHHGEKEDLLLSELQGNYTFFLFDSHQKKALAARDSSGELELFYCINPDNGSVSFTNSLDQLPPGEDGSRWREVPPGHYVSGAKPALHQFALTPMQLQARERNESTDIGYSEEEPAGVLL